MTALRPNTRLRRSLHFRRWSPRSAAESSQSIGPGRGRFPAEAEAGAGSVAGKRSACMDIVRVPRPPPGERELLFHRVGASNAPLTDHRSTGSPPRGAQDGPRFLARWAMWVGARAAEDGCRSPRLRQRTARHAARSGTAVTTPRFSERSQALSQLGARPR